MCKRKSRHAKSPPDTNEPGLAACAAMLLWSLAIGPAAAHGPAPLPTETPWRWWNFDPLVLAPLLIALWLYWRGLRQLRIAAGRGRGVTYAHASSFILGMAMLFAALVSPIDTLGETLLSAHMAQHGLLVAVAPPLLLAGKPGVVFVWALSPGWRKALFGTSSWRSLAGLANALSRPRQAAVLHGTILWLWHAPAAFDAAVASYALHAIEHILFFGTALLFWRALLGARSPRRAGAALGAAFATLIHGGLLGALITMAPNPLYAWYAGRAPSWGLSPLEDQQLAGLLMWVPMGIIYLGGCLMLAGKLVASPQARAGKAAAPAPAGQAFFDTETDQNRRHKSRQCGSIELTCENAASLPSTSLAGRKNPYGMHHGRSPPGVRKARPDCSLHGPARRRLSSR